MKLNSKNYAKKLTRNKPKNSKTSLKSYFQNFNGFFGRQDKQPCLPNATKHTFLTHFLVSWCFKPKSLSLLQETKVKIMVSSKLTNLQLELLQLFAYNVQESQLLNIKEMLSAYFAEQLLKDMDNLWEQEGWTNETMENWANEHIRTPYKD